MPAFLNASAPFPMRFPDGSENPSLVHLNRVIDHPNITIGDHSYASSFDPPADWAARLAPYTYPGAPERLTLGKFCQIAHGVTIITASANHVLDGLTSYPFPIFDHASFGLWREALSDLPDTVIGNDVWIGHGAMILPGARIGSGVIIGAGAVVSGRVPDYCIVAGNPARVLRNRFDAATTERLMALAWWDRTPDWIEAALPLLAAGDLTALEALTSP